MNKNKPSRVKSISRKLPFSLPSQDIKAGIKLQIKQLQHDKIDHSALELKRFSRDLQTSLDRLFSGEYRQTSFQPRKLLNIPERTEEIFQDLLFFWSIGKVWQAILKKVKLRANSRILDIGCGFVPKVSFGLYYLDFRGSLCLLDSNKTALKYAEKFLLFLHTRFKLQLIANSIWKLPANEKFHLIVANHCLDDLLLSEYCKNNRINAAAAYHNEEIFMRCWDQICNDKDLLKNTSVRLARKLHQQLIPEGNLILLDYHGFSHKSLKLKKLQKHIRLFQNMLRNELLNLGYQELFKSEFKVQKFDRIKITRKDLIAFKKPTGMKSL